MIFMSEIERVLNNCTSCGICLDECDFLQKHCTSPRDLAVAYKEHGFRETPTIPYSCNICSFCKAQCPEGLDIGKMMLEIRQELVENGTGPLLQHAAFKDAVDFYISDEFKAVIPSTDGDTTSLFFPGCSLSSYSPELVLAAYDYLREKLPGTGIMLGCCGGPTYLTGDEKSFKDVFQDMASEAGKLGVEQVIAACPFCYGLLKQYRPDLNPVTLYQILDKIGLPVGKPENLTINIHDPCNARFEPEIQESVREIIKETGLEVKEIDHIKEETHCCGMGGLVYAVDGELGSLRSRRTLDESGEVLVTYCATCREILQGQGGRVVHLLDLIFNSSPDDASRSPPQVPEEATENMILLKKTLTQRVK